MCVHAFGFCLHRAAQIEEVNDVAFRVTEEREERKKKKESCSAAALALPAALFFPPFFPPPYVYYTSKYAPISTAETGCLSHHPAFHPPPLPHFPSFFFFCFLRYVRRKYTVISMLNHFVQSLVVSFHFSIYDDLSSITVFAP